MSVWNRGGMTYVIDIAAADSSPGGASAVRGGSDGQDLASEPPPSLAPIKSGSPTLPPGEVHAENRIRCIDGARRQ